MQTHTHTYHSRISPEGVAESSQILLRETYVLPKLFITVSIKKTASKSVWLF
jgi:hypothetical protein